MASQNLLTPQFPAANSPQRASSMSSVLSTRKKVVLEPGHSLMDWIRMGRSGTADLSGVGGKILEVSQEDLALHNKQDDAWTCIRGRIYNITHYLDYHPGGMEELMRGAGKDGTNLFDEVHKWVNAESMLEKCYVGKLKTVIPVYRRVSDLRGSGASQKSAASLSLNGPLAALKPPSGPPVPRYDWFQNSKTVTVVVYTKWTSMRQEYVIIDRTERKILITMYIDDYTYHIHTELEHSILSNYEVMCHQDTGKVEVLLNKEIPDTNWLSLGKPLEKNNTYAKTADQDTVFRECVVDGISAITHDTKRLCVAVPHGSRMCIPLGYHVHVKHHIQGMEIARSYTVVIPSLDPSQQDSRVQDGQVLYLMVKIYPEGALTPWLGGLKEGDKLMISSWEGNFLESRLEACSHLVMYAAGTGFTPMVRLLYHSLESETLSQRVVKLMFFNKKEGDIIWREQLDALAKRHNRFKVSYVLSEADDTWQGSTGRIRKELMQEFTPPVSSDTKILICACGPTTFTKTVQQLAKDLGYSDDNFHAFLA